MSKTAARYDAPPFVSLKVRTKAVRLSLLLVVLIATSLAFTVSPAFGSSRVSKSDLQKAKDSVAQAKKEADSAAAKYTDAYSALVEISDKLTDTQSQLDAASNSMSGLQKKASAQAKDAYIRTSTESVDATYEDVVNEHRRDQFLATVSEFDDKQLTQLVGLQEDLEVTKEELAQLQKDRKSTLEALEKEKKEFETKLNSAAKAQKDLEAKLARDAKAAAAVKKAATKSSGGSGGIIVVGGSGLACPVQGAVSFRDTWGDPRSGGRSHKGTDMFAASGTPNVAVGNGTVFFQSEGTGGLSAYVSSGGNTYYYTHLKSTVGGSRSVQRGEIIGYTGSSGNADGNAPHTHFEIRLGGPNGTKINPYPTLRSIC